MLLVRIRIKRDCDTYADEETVFRVIGGPATRTVLNSNDGRHLSRLRQGEAMLIRALSIAMLLMASIGHASYSQDNSEHRFVVKVSDQDASISISTGEEVEESETLEAPENGIVIACAAANMSTLDNGRVVIDCHNAVFSSAKGVHGTAEQVVCDTKNHLVTFQNNQREPIELKLDGVEGEGYSLVGVAISLDLATNQIRALGQPLQINVGQLTPPQIDMGQPIAPHGSSFPSQVLPPNSAPFLTPQGQPNGVAPLPSLPSGGTPFDLNNESPSLPPPNNSALPPSLGPSRPQLPNSPPPMSDNSTLETFSFFVGLLR